MEVRNQVGLASKGHFCTLLILSQLHAARLKCLGKTAFSSQTGSQDPARERGELGLALAMYIFKGAW